MQPENSSKMTFKTIVSGHLEFGSNRSYEKVMSMLDHRIENYYKNDVLIKIDEVFHYNPQAAYRFFDTTSAINYLNNEFSFGHSKMNIAQR